LIVYRKSTQLRLRRASSPEPPFWCATTIAPYSPRRSAPIAIDYLELRASSGDKLEVFVSERVTDELERAASRLTAPVLIEATEFAEDVFRRGEEALAFCREHALPAIYLASARGALPQTAAGTTVIASWPLDFDRLEAMFAEARETWGVAVPVMYPVTTDLGALEQLAKSAKMHGAAFLAALPLTVDATARQAIAQSLSLDDDHETYAMLFHADLEPVHVATERHIAALAHEHGMADFIVPPLWEEKSNWNAAVLLTLTATRMLAMEEETGLAAILARSARVVAELDKPITRIAEAASLSIVGALDEVSVDILTDWLARGTSPFAERINARWRLRRDYQTSDAEPSPES
jgi:hypothetical protein